MKKFLAFGFLLIISCGEKPYCTLSDDQLIPVLTDIQVAEAAAQTLTGTLKDSILEVYYNQVFAIHGVEREEFELCFMELESDPKRLSLIYERVIEELNRQSAQADDREIENKPGGKD